MTGARRLEDLDSWATARVLVRRIYQVTTPAPIKHDFAYCGQVRKAAISIMSNIAEGFGRSTDKEFARFLDIARGSSFETQSLIHVATDIAYLDTDTSDELIKLSFQVIAQVTALAKYLRTGSQSPTSFGAVDLDTDEIGPPPEIESDLGHRTSDPT